jgi:hypothetical protein
MAVDWSKVSDEDRSFHESMKNTPFGNRKAHFTRKFGEPVLVEEYDVQGLIVDILVWEHEKGYASVMNVEEEPFDDSMLAPGDCPGNVVSRMLTAFCDGSDFTMHTITHTADGEKQKTTHGSTTGLMTWAYEREHLFEEQAGTLHVKQEFLKVER